MIALGRADILIQGTDTRDAVAPADTPVQLGAKEDATVTVPGKDVEAGNTRKVVVMEMARIAIGKEEEAVVAVAKEVVVVARDVEDAVAPTEIHCERVERTHRRSMEPPVSRFNCTATTLSC